MIDLLLASLKSFFLVYKPYAKVQNIRGYLIGGGISLIFLLFLILIIYKIFKIDIVLWYRSSCHPLLGEKVSDGKIYDAYVLYPKNRESCLYSSDIFALKILPEVLERQCGYNLFIFGRNDLAGEEDASENHLAVYNALIQDGIKIILIELEKIEDYANMPESIKYVKQKYGAIRWTGDFSESVNNCPSTAFQEKASDQTVMIDFQ
ncbi:hypothetical protein CIB84_010800, partial [Bambusicola thoracicus]